MIMLNTYREGDSQTSSSATPRLLPCSAVKRPRVHASSAPLRAPLTAAQVSAGRATRSRWSRLA